nr:inactive protein RESTRICTED TEV MOVEMENT 2-like [Ipomoea batatas]
MYGHKHEQCGRAASKGDGNPEEADRGQEGEGHPEVAPQMATHTHKLKEKYGPWMLVPRRDRRGQGRGGNRPTNSRQPTGRFPVTPGTTTVGVETHSRFAILDGLDRFEQGPQNEEEGRYMKDFTDALVSLSRNFPKGIRLQADPPDVISNLLLDDAAGNYEDFDPDYDQIQEPEVDTLLIHLPGFRKDQLRVQLIRTVILRISGERHLEGDKWKRFLKEFQVSSNCDTNRINAKFQSGTLYVTLPKLITTTEGEESEDSESEPTEPENVSDNKGVGAGEETKLDKKAANGKSDGEKSGAAKVDGYSGNAEVQLKRSRKMMNVVLVVVLVVGVGLYLNSKMTG